MADLYRKSIDFFTFLGGKDFSSFYEKPTKHGKETKKSSFAFKDDWPIQTKSTDIANDDIGRLEHSGRFRWQAEQKRGSSTVKLGSEYWEIAPLTGSMQVDKYKDSPTDMMKTPSKFSAADNWAYSYGFYDSGAGVGDLTNHNQSYVYVTPDVSNWMGDLTKRNAKIANARFSTFCLPGSHDAGSYDLAAVGKLTKDATFLGLLGGMVGLTVAQLAQRAVMEIVANFAVTQKDNAATQLDMGARYFDFRPGYCVTGIPIKGIFHQHGFIPGIPYETFLKDVFKWLLAHAGEIVVVRVDFSGFVEKKMRPPLDELTAIVSKAQKDAGAGAITIAGRDDLKIPYSELIKKKMRLFVLYDKETGHAQPARKYDSYKDELYETADYKKVIQGLDGMNKAGQTDHHYTVLQLQCTASKAKGAITGTVANASKSGSCLMSTKPNTDRHTYPWLLKNVRKNLSDGQLTVFLNDFVDNALTMHAMKVMEG